MPFRTLPYLLLLIIQFTTQIAATLVTISNGTIQGGRCSNTASNYYLSIPFANPPVGALRLKSPQPFTQPYNGTLKATKPAPSCFQFGTSSVLPGPQSEDCLYLEVYTPANASSSSQLPVKVWLYGGTFEDGGISDPLYTGCTSTADAVLVTVNYRLGPLGYLALEGTDLIGNYGAEDQLQALRWVQENIAQFGGDPKQVLLFGQSAGATGSFALATLPEITALAKAVAMESGGGVELPTISTAQPFHEQFVRALNCSTTELDCILSKTPQEMNTTYNNMPKNKTVFVFSLDDYQGAAFPWSPLAGSALFPQQPSQVGVRIPSIFGSNGLEGSIFVLGAFGSTGAKDLTATDYEDFLRVNFGSFAPQVLQQYPLTLFNQSAFEAMSIVMRDYTFRCSAYRGATLAVGKGLPVWTYSFNQTPSCPWSQGLSAELLPILGPTHTAEIPFVFGAVAGLPLPNGNCTFTAGEQNISAFMKSAWTAMAQSGTPSRAWPMFSPNGSQGINFQAEAVSPGVVDYSMCSFWSKINTAVNGAAISSNSTTTAPPASSSTTSAANERSGFSISLEFVAAIILMAFVV